MASSDGWEAMALTEALGKVEEVLDGEPDCVIVSRLAEDGRARLAHLHCRSDMDCPLGGRWIPGHRRDLPDSRPTPRKG